MLESHRTLYFSLTNEEYFKESALNVIAFDLDEGLSTLFSGRIEFSTLGNALYKEQFLDKDIYLKIYRNGQLEREVNGIVKSFISKDKGNKDQVYEVIVIPALGRLVYQKNYKIFQGKSLVEITEVIFKDIGLTDYSWSLKHSHTAREYCVQYDENNLQFLQRLWAEEGVFYYFEHKNNKHILVLSDDTSTLTVLDAVPEYNMNSAGVMNQPYIYQFFGKISISPNEVMMRDYYFKRPSSQLEFSKYSDSGLSKISDYEHYDFPGRYVEESVGKVFSAARVHFLRRDARTAHGKSNVSYLTTGFNFQLEKHSHIAYNHNWLITHVRHQGFQPQALEAYGYEGATTYNNAFACIPSTVQWAPEPWVLAAVNPKPLICGPQVAVVVGASGEEIYTDEFGRVKVQFPWDRYGAKNEESSAWIRVSQEWAGQNYGAQKLPRVGHEVIVDFLEGDPDQPLIIGSVYNAIKRQPYKLPEHKTRMALRSKTYKGDGFNELTFEDQAGAEFIYQHAQKDMTVMVKNDQTHHIMNDQHIRIDNNLTETIQETASFTYEHERHSSIQGNDTHIVMGKYTQSISDKWVTETGDTIDLEAGGKNILSAGSSVTFKVGGSFMRIDPSGIYFVAPTVNILNGGGAGKSPKVSDLPKDPEVIKTMLFSLSHNQDTLGFIKEPYKLFRDDELIEEDFTDEKGNISVKHSPNTEQYKISLLSGEEYQVTLKESYKEGNEGKIQQIKAQGFRASRDEENPDQSLADLWQSQVEEDSELSEVTPSDTPHETMVDGQEKINVEYVLCQNPLHTNTQWLLDEQTAKGQVYKQRTNIGFTPLINGNRIFNELAQKIIDAKKSIDIITWGFDPAMQLTGYSVNDERLGDLLERKALQGVEVRVLVWELSAGGMTRVKEYSPEKSVRRIEMQHALKTYEKEIGRNHQREMEKITAIDEKESILSALKSQFDTKSQFNTRAIGGKDIGSIGKKVFEEQIYAYGYKESLLLKSNDLYSSYKIQSHTPKDYDAVKKFMTYENKRIITNDNPKRNNFLAFRTRDSLMAYVAKSIEDSKHFSEVYAGAKSVILATGATHHQKMVLIDYETPESAVGFVMGHNMHKDYYDNDAHTFFATDVRWPGFRPFQDISSMVHGPVLHDLNDNFCKAWDKVSTEESLYDKRASIPAEKFAVSRGKQGVQYFPLTAQICRTQPEYEDQSILGLYKHATSKVKNYIYTENQYFRYGPLADHVKQTTQMRMNEGCNPVYWFVVTNPPNTEGEAAYTMDMMSRLGHSEALPKAQRDITQEYLQRLKDKRDGLPERMAPWAEDIKYSDIVGDFVNKGIQTAKDTASVALDDAGYAIVTAPKAAWEGAKKIPGRTLTAIKNAPGKMWDGIIGIPQAVMDIPENVGNSYKDFKDSISDGYQGAKKVANIYKENSQWLAQNKGKLAAMWDESNRLDYEKLYPEETKKNREKLEGYDSIEDMMKDLPEDIKTIEDTENAQDAMPMRASELEQLESEFGLKAVIGTLKSCVFVTEDDRGKLHYYTNIYIHSKLMLIDDAFLTLGSANINTRSFKADSELNIAVPDGSAAKYMRETLWQNHTKTLDKSDSINDLLDINYETWQDLMDKNWTQMHRKRELLCHLTHIYEPALAIGMPTD